MMHTIGAVFVNEENEILSLKRAAHKELYPNKWDIVSGKVEEGENIFECLRREVQEEIGITHFEVLKKAEPRIYSEGDKEWLATPFLCRIREGSVKLNDEHTEFKWMRVHELMEQEGIVPLKKDLMSFFKI